MNNYKTELKWVLIGAIVMGVITSAIVAFFTKKNSLHEDSENTKATSAI